MNREISMERDQEGYLLDPEAWNDDIARRLAAQEKLELTDATWSILRFMREYWHEHQVAPDVRHVLGFMTSEQGVDKRTAKDQLFQLFPYGYVQQACKVAGMIKPRVWSTG